ncbi:MAG: 50S ribosomal protein L13e [Candidatus Aenigmarchaeota archaeon ex4484_224]|nr:MAG: 50S ribosomal protein L13e [Candidatus Aenigmarchaeota archaeon ex4484_224]
MRAIEPIVKSPKGHLRKGKGFSLEEIKKAGISLQEAKKLGVPIDKRRKSIREENVKMLKEFLSNSS